MTAKPLAIALLGGDEPLADAVLRLAEERGIEFESVIPLTLEETEGSAEFAGQALPVQAAEAFDWAAVQLVAVTSRSPAAVRHVEAALKAGRPVLASEELPLSDGPLLHRLPCGAARAIANVAAAVQHKAGLAGLQCTLNLPMCHFGRAAIDELSGQTRGLFNLESPEPEVLPMQIAFNLVPLAPASGEDAASRYEVAVESGVRGLMGRDDLPVTVMAAWVPVFYGYSAVLHGIAEQPLDRLGLRALLLAAQGVTVMDEAIPGGVPSPATDAQDSEAAFVGRLRVDARDPRRFSVWLVFDGLRLEAAEIVERVENLIEPDRISMLT